MRWTFCLALALALPTGTLAGQLAPIARGTRVRVTSPNGPMAPYRVTGTLESINDASIVVLQGNGRATTLTRGEGSRMEVSAGPGTCGRQRAGCVLLGFVGGVLVGFGAGAVSCGKRPTECYAPILTVPAGALVGIIIGATVGGERWKKVAELPTRLSLAPNPSDATRPWSGVRLEWQLTF